MYNKITLKALNREGWKVDISFFIKKINEETTKVEKNQKRPISQHRRQLVYSYTQKKKYTNLNA